MVCGESGHICVVPVLEGHALSFIPLSVTLPVGLSSLASIMSRHDPSLPTLLSDFLPNECWIVSKAVFDIL